MTRAIEVYIPDALMPEAHRIKRFFDAMVYKLAQNTHKPGFASSDVEHCMQRMGEEMAELREAIGTGSIIGTLLEAADVANFAMIGSSAAIEKGVLPDANTDNMRRAAEELAGKQWKHVA